MAIRWYLVPKIGTGVQGDAFRPKYIAGAIAEWRAIDYGNDLAFLVEADVTNSQHNTINGNADVLSLPTNLDTTIGASLATVRAKCEALGIPAGWMTSAMTIRQALRWVGRLFLLNQRLQGRSNLRLLPAGVMLDTIISDLPTALRNGLIDAAQSWGVDTTGVTGSMTLRQALRQVADNMNMTQEIV